MRYPPVITESPDGHMLTPAYPSTSLFSSLSAVRPTVEIKIHTERITRPQLSCINVHGDFSPETTGAISPIYVISFSLRRRD